MIDNSTCRSWKTSLECTVFILGFIVSSIYLLESINVNALGGDFFHYTYKIKDLGLENELINHNDLKELSKTGISKKLRAHPLGISLASVDLENLSTLNNYKNNIYAN